MYALVTIGAAPEVTSADSHETAAAVQLALVTSIIATELTFKLLAQLIKSCVLA